MISASVKNIREKEKENIFSSKLETYEKLKGASAKSSKIDSGAPKEISTSSHESTNSNASSASSSTSTSPTNSEIKLLEWRFNQFLGEKLSDIEMKEEENQSYVISDMKFTDDGDFLIVGDKGGRVILFEKTESRKNKRTPKFNYFHEYSAFDKDFDVHKSTEYSEIVRSLCVLPTQYQDKIDILSCGYRTIRLDRVFNSKIKFFSSGSGQHSPHAKEDSRASVGSIGSNSTKHSLANSNFITVPKLRSMKRETSTKCKVTIKIENSSELNSLSYNKYFTNQVLSSDDNKILLWDLSETKEAYCLVDMEDLQDPSINEENPERITKSLICDSDPHIFAFGTNYGKIKICDTRSSSHSLNILENSSTFLDEFQNITNSGFNLTKTLFSSQIMAVHDLNFNMNNDNYFVSRHFLSVNTWDRRNTKQPVTKYLTYEPIISKLSHLYMKNYMATDKFSLSTDITGKFILTGGYNSMFHVFDVDQRLNTQITVDGVNEKVMNTNIIRKINGKGSCFYKKDEPSVNNINFDSKILHHCYSKKDNFIALAIQNCIYTYTGNIIKKETAKKN